MAEEMKTLRGWSWRMVKQERRKRLKDEECESERQEVRVISSAEKPLADPIWFSAKYSSLFSKAERKYAAR
jgi:hypothetical protein